jgi:uncharacterized protein (TIGR02246 family)
MENRTHYLSRIVFIGRSYQEYMKMFDLKEEELRGIKILDCPSGACSFAARAADLGFDVTASDVAYYFSSEELEEKGRADLAHVKATMEETKGNYVWDFFQSVDDLISTREKALSDTVRNMKEKESQYVAAELPHLPFEDNVFDLTLSAHFLFMYADKLDYSFHLETIKELMRVTSREIRIFPLVDQTGKKYPELVRLKDAIRSLGWEAEERPVPYEFQKGACSLLKLKKISDSGRVGCVILSSDQKHEVQVIYEQLIKAWNSRSASGMADLFAEEGELIGFDGSLISGKKAIFEHLSPIFEAHPTPPFIYKVKRCQEVGTSILLRAIVGMVPPGKDELDPALNAHQTLLGKKEDNEWKIVLFQNTPAQFHGRPDLREEMTEELKSLRN